MSYTPEIFFDYKIVSNAGGLNTVDDFVLYTEPCKSCKTLCRTIENGIKMAFIYRLQDVNPIQAKEFIAYHYQAYKGDKHNFIIGLRVLLTEINTAKEATAFMLAYLHEKEQELNQTKKADIRPIDSTPSNNIKLTWNGQNNALIDIFRQLKTMVNNKNEYLLADSYDDIAKFLMNSFTNFEHTKESTISRQLNTQNLVKKTEKRITISCKAPDSNES